MSFSRLLKQLKNRFLRRRRWLSLTSWLVIVVAGIALSLRFMGDHSPESTHSYRNVKNVDSQTANSVPRPTTQREDVLNSLQKHPENRSVIINTIYVCGEELQNIGKLSAAEIIKKLQENKEWRVQFNSAGNVVMTHDVDDLSPACKKSAYIGLDKQGNLAMFDGPPSKKQVIRTFFQMNVQYLESSLPKETVQQLVEGIRISDLAEYNSVLSTFSDFALEETEKVMNPSL